MDVSRRRVGRMYLPNCEFVRRCVQCAAALPFSLSHLLILHQKHVKTHISTNTKRPEATKATTQTLILSISLLHCYDDDESPAIDHDPDLRSH